MVNASSKSRWSWDRTWQAVARDVGNRSACVRRRIGAVIVSKDNRIVSTGYNGPPANYGGGQCGETCPRGLGLVEASPDYDACIALHAEMNALLFADRSRFEGGTIYVSSSCCIGCARMISTSGLDRVVMQLDEFADAHRDPESAIAWLIECGLDVTINSKKYNGYRRIFYDYYGIGPHDCYFCSKQLAVVEVIHHIDGDHENNDPLNLAPSHSRCHTHHHHPPGVSRGKRKQYNASRVRCAQCSLETTKGAMGSHQKSTGHVGVKSVHDTSCHQVSEATRKKMSESHRGKIPNVDRTPLMCECGKGPFLGKNGLNRHMTSKQCPK
jgi:dCMP deaminase